jgi:hypothetical protein
VSGQLEITRLLQNPLGATAPDGEPGDMVRLSDGVATIYLSPAEFERATDADLRYLLAKDGAWR